MSYEAAADMQASTSLLRRIAACAAQEGQPEPWAWSSNHMYEIVARSDWIDAWDYAEHHPDHRNMNPDTGARSDVITDAMILATVAAVRAEQQSA